MAKLQKEMPTASARLGELDFMRKFHKNHDGETITEQGCKSHLGKCMQSYQTLMAQLKIVNALKPKDKSSKTKKSDDDDDDDDDDEESEESEDS